MCCSNFAQSAGTPNCETRRVYFLSQARRPFSSRGAGLKVGAGLRRPKISSLTRRVGTHFSRDTLKKLVPGQINLPVDGTFFFEQAWMEFNSLTAFYH